MYLKALEIQGFKSFADKTRLTFEKDITAIVGPNGSGKSNISDAVLWVMGEQRSKALRGAKMEDVIFGGTEKRSPLGFAQVSLIIDNSARIFDSDASEIMLTRRYYRSGESEYYINRESVRLKDIHGLLMDTGLGRDGYSIIGQGRIAEIVSSRSTDRREVFEEAAGISRFRYRKEEAERKLEKTEENLVRINDKIDELELQVGPLKKQSETAKRYLVLRDELRVLEISVWMSTLDRLHAQSALIQTEFEQASLALEKAKAELEALYASSGNITERMHQKDIESEQARERLSAVETAASACESEAAVLRANVKSSEEAKARMLHDIAEQESRVGEIRQSIAEGRTRIAQLEDILKELGEKTKQNNNVLDGCRMKLKNREDMVTQLTGKLNSLSVEGRSMDSRIHMLSEMEKDYEGYSRAVKTVMREAGRGTLRGVHGPVANLLRAALDDAAGEERAAFFQMRVEVGQQPDHEVGDQVRGHQSRLAWNREKKIAFCRRYDVRDAVRLDIFPRHAHRRRVVVNRPHRFRAELCRRDGQHAGARAHVKDGHARFYELLHRPQAHRRRRVGAGAEGRAGIEPEHDLARLWLVFLPGGLDHDALADLVRVEIFFPAVRPVLVLHPRCEKLRRARIDAARRDFVESGAQ